MNGVLNPSRRAIALTLVSTVLACTGGRIASSSLALDPREKVEFDSARGSDFAGLIIPGDTSPSPTMTAPIFPKLPRDLRGRDVAASMLFAVIVDSTGRVEPASRTLIASTGDVRIVKAVCDAIATATLGWSGGIPRRTVALISMMYFTASTAHGEAPQPPDQKAFDPKAVKALLWTMTQPQRQQWFADQQPCASLQAR